MESSPKRLSISEETLRLQLSELELRLRIFFQEQLAQKASAADVRLSEARLNALERGDFTPAFSRALTEKVEAGAKAAKTTAWTGRERLVMLAGIFITFLVFALNIYVVAKSNSNPTPKATPAALEAK